jgi:hypothetical protein
VVDLVDAFVGVDGMNWMYFVLKIRFSTRKLRGVSHTPTL